MGGERPQRLSRSEFASFTARLKLCPDDKIVFTPAKESWSLHCVARRA
jgi:hypothetical protein